MGLMHKRGYTYLKTIAGTVLAMAIIVTLQSVKPVFAGSDLSDVIRQDADIMRSVDQEEDSSNNRRCINFSDFQAGFSLDMLAGTQILWRTERWEDRAWDGKGPDTLGYPSVVRNIYGDGADYKYYLYYSHHGPSAGIGCAVSDCIEGPYRKLAEIDSTRLDSQVLRCGGKYGDAAHFSSPCVVWNEDVKAWYMYFHFLKNEWKEGKGHQKTALASCSNLRENSWKPFTDDSGNLKVVLPTTSERWMNSQSSYHAIQRLHNGLWSAFLRGTGGSFFDDRWVQDPCKLGFAFSKNAESWEYATTNPVIYQGDGRGGKSGVYRPKFVAYLGGVKYLVCWQESDSYDVNPVIVCGRTSDFKAFEKIRDGYSQLPVGDGMMCLWRIGTKLFVFSGRYVYVMRIFGR